MDADMLIKWWTEFMAPALTKYSVEAIPVMDNASYHTTPAEGSLNVKTLTTKKQLTDQLDNYNVPYNKGRAPRGDNLEQLKLKLSEWLKINAAEHGVKMNITRFQECCKRDGHRPPLMTPPYHPELQPIEELWRDVKCSVARKLAGTRTMTVLRSHVEEAFRHYGTAAKTVNKISRARANEKKYRVKGVYADVIDLTGADESEDEQDIIESDSGSDDDI